MSKKNKSYLQTGMKLFIRLLLILILCAVGYVGYGFIDLRNALFQVYVTKPEYMQTTPQADIIVVEFSDYTCEWCRKLHPILQEAIAKDGKVSLIPRPVAYNDVWKARLVSSLYAAAIQGKAMDMHDAIYKSWPILSEEKLFEVAKGIGLDTNQLSRDMRSDEVREAIIDNERFFDAWGLKTAPALLVGKSFIYIPNNGLPTVDEMLDKFEEARQ